jgi:hypothetical protein
MRTVIAYDNIWTAWKLRTVFPSDGTKQHHLQQFGPKTFQFKCLGKFFLILKKKIESRIQEHQTDPKYKANPKLVDEIHRGQQQSKKHFACKLWWNR